MTKWICNECKFTGQVCKCETTLYAPYFCVIQKVKQADWRIDNTALNTATMERVETETELPDWCKVGKWFWHPEDMAGGRYLKITEIRDGGVYAKEKEDYDPDYLCFDLVRNYSKQARLRPYNVEEMKALVGKVVTSPEGCVSVVTDYDSSLKKVCIYADWYDSLELKNSVWRYENKPCGVLEHMNDAGEWVE